MNNLLKIYNILEQKYGNRNWWPTTLDGYIKPTYHGKKLNEKQRFEIVVGAILTQNTAWKNVEKALVNLNKENLLDAKKLAKVNVRRLARLIRPAGYFNQKAKRLKVVADYFLKNPNLLKTKSINELREKLLSVNGIGPETADSIILYAAEKPIFVVDAYTRRIFSRIGLLNEDADYSYVQKIFMGNLRNKTRLFNNYHAVIVEHAKEHCRKSPLCDGCPLNMVCEFPRNNR